MYHSQLDFIMDRYTIYLRPKGFRKDDWAIGLFKMTAQDVEDVIKDFDEEWKKAFEDAIALPLGITQTDPSDKGKGKVGFKRKDAVEVPPVAQKKKKFKFSMPTIETTLTEDEHDLIAVRL